MRLLTLIILLFAATASAEDLYVDNSVGTSGSGTSVSPWKELSDITWGGSAGQFGSGDTLYISGGATTSSQTYNITAQLNFGDIGGADGSVTDMTYVKVWPDSSHNGTVIIDGGDDIDGVDNEGDTTYGRIFQIKDADYLTIDGEVDGERHIRLQNWGRAGWFGDPSAISGFGGSTEIKSVVIRYVEIINDDILCPDGTGLFADCQYDSTESNLEWNYSEWNYERKDCMYLGSLGAGSILEYNYLDGCVSVAVSAGVASTAFGSGAIIQYNEIKGYKDLSGRGGPDGIKSCGGATIRYNTIYHETLENAIRNPNHAAEDGIQVLAYNHYVKIYGNTIYGYSQGPIRLDPSNSVGTEHIWIYNNALSSRYTSALVQRGIELGGQLETGFVDVKIFNNTIAGFGSRGIHVETDGSENVDVEIYNNILLDSSINISSGDPASLVTDYNLVINSDGSQGNNDDSPQANDPWDVAGTFEFTAYTVPTSGTNTTGDDFTLAYPSSMAIGVGLSSSLITDVFTDDITGNTRSDPWDIGAYAYGSVSTGSITTGTGSFQSGTGSLQ